MPNIGWTELIIILVIVLLLFGANKLPDLARSMGRSARIFKSEVDEMKYDDAGEAPKAQPNAIESGRNAETQSVAQPESFWDKPEHQRNQTPPAQQ